jgi:glycerol transport system ATP-binding protein
LKSLFKDRQSIAIYATTEGPEALALGGTTSLLHQGRVIQSGPALAQFYQPTNIDAADLCNEPPLNHINAPLKHKQVGLDQAYAVDKIPHLDKLEDGSYIFAIRPDHIQLQSSAEPEFRFNCTVELAEISASETYLHIAVYGIEQTKTSWIAHLKGIHQFPTGKKITVFIPLSKLYVFDDSKNAQSWPPLFAETR